VGYDNKKAVAKCRFGDETFHWQLIAPLLTTVFISHEKQGRTQEGADGAKAPPEIPRKKLFTHSNPEHFFISTNYI